METQPSMDDLFLVRVHQSIEKNLANEQFSVEDLAKEVGLSRSMLHRKLIKLTGKSAGEHILEVRLLHAKSILEHNSATVSETAYKVGFKSPSYFNKVFKKHFDISPGELKKEYFTSVKQPKVLDKKSENKIPKNLTLKRRQLFYIVTIVIISSIASYTFINIPKTEMSIAVLPIQNLTGDPNNDYFVDGIHDALIGELGQLSSLRVISRTSTLRYKETDMLMKDIAKELGTEMLAEASIISSEDSIRLLLQLIDVYPKERHIMAKEYHDAISNVLNVQSTIAKEIAEEINLKLTNQEKQQIERVRTVNPETYKAYLRGMYYLNKETPESFRTGMQYLQDAIDRDPGDPFAYAGLAVGYATKGHGQIDSKEAFIRAEKAANKAIKLDPTIDEAYTALALLMLYQDWNWNKAKHAFEKALENNPNNEIAHAHYAWYHILFNDIDKAIWHGSKATMIEPTSAAYSSWLTLLHYHNHNYKQTEYWAKKTLITNKKSAYANRALGLICLKKNEFNEALKHFEKLPEKSIYWKTLRGYCYVKCGHKEKAIAYWNEIEELSKKRRVNPCYRGMMAAYLGYTDMAFELLNEAVETKSYPVTYVKIYPCLESIREDPRYNQLLLKMNLPTNN